MCPKFIIQCLNRFFLVSFAGILFSCNSSDQMTLQDVMKTAGSNDAELQKVLDHYSRPQDSLKRKAAEFLILNMPAHFGQGGEEVEKFAALFSMIDTLSYRQHQVSNDDKSHLGDSLINKIGNPAFDLSQRIDDTQIISAVYLINNIDLAFKAWENAPWAKQITFDDFCEYILPYRLRNERLEYWRPQFYNQYTKLSATASNPKDLQSVYDHLHWHLNSESSFTMFFSKYFPFQQGVGDIFKGRVGGCETFSFFSVIGMRSVGIPAALDFLPYWGNLESRHFMTRLIDHKKRKRISNRNTLENTWGIVEFSSEIRESTHQFLPEELPAGMYIQNVKTVPKVYRYTFAEDPFLKDVNTNIDPVFIAPDFQRTNIRDVTDEYVENSNVTVKIDPGYRKYKLSYLCVFNLNGWVPVSIAKIENDQVLFKKVGRNVMYLPTVFENGIHIPVGNPFYIDPENKVHAVKKKAKTKQKVTLVRKTTLFAYTAFHTELLKDGVFEGANTSDFSDAELLYAIKQHPFYMNEVKVSNKKAFRYLRYAAPKGDHWEADNIAEVQFYADQDSSALTGAFIGIEGNKDHEISKAFDDNMDTFYENSRYKNGWIGLDLGKDNQQVVSKIRFSPRSDTNCIMPGKEYELFYWNGDWISAGVKKAGGYTIQFDRVPSGVLFWLKCKSGGKEERIFTYENGKQIWW